MRILYRDDDLVAVHKPSGLLVHRSPIDRHERRFAVQEARNLVGRHVYPVHRLDKSTSGVLLFGLSPAAARGVAEAFAARRVRKTYVAVVRGHPPRRGVVDAPLVDRGDASRAAALEAGAAVQEARTLFCRLATAELPVAVSRYPTSRYALLALRPRTGRRHQLRRHLNGIDHPIVGDGKHGDYRHNRLFRERFDSHRLLLAAVELAVPHPATGRRVTITAAPEPSFMRVVDALGWHDALPPRFRPEDDG